MIYLWPVRTAWGSSPWRLQLDETKEGIFFSLYSASLWSFLVLIPSFLGRVPWTNQGLMPDWSPKVAKFPQTLRADAVNRPVTRGCHYHVRQPHPNWPSLYFTQRCPSDGMKVCAYFLLFCLCSSCSIFTATSESDLVVKCQVKSCGHLKW